MHATCNVFSAGRAAFVPTKLSLSASFRFGFVFVSLSLCLSPSFSPSLASSRRLYPRTDRVVVLLPFLLSFPLTLPLPLALSLSLSLSLSFFYYSRSFYS